MFKRVFLLSVLVLHGMQIHTMDFSKWYSFNKPYTFYEDMRDLEKAKGEREIQRFVKEKCWLAQLPVPVKNIIAIYCWFNRAQSMEKNKRLWSTYPWYRLGLGRMYNCIGKDDCIFPIPNKNIRYVASGDLCSSKFQFVGSDTYVYQCYANSDSDSATVGQLLKSKGVFDINPRLLGAFSGEGNRAWDTDFDCRSDFPSKHVHTLWHVDNGGAINEITLRNQKEATSSVVAQTGNSSYRQIFYIDDLDAWYVYQAGWCSLTGLSTENSMVFRKNPDAIISDNKDHLSEFLKYRGVCKSLENSK